MFWFSKTDVFLHTDVLIKKLTLIEKTFCSGLPKGGNYLKDSVMIFWVFNKKSLAIYYVNEKVLLSERKRHTAHHVAMLLCLLTGGGGMPSSLGWWGYLMVGVPPSSP